MVCPNAFEGLRNISLLLGDHSERWLALVRGPTQIQPDDKGEAFLGNTFGDGNSAKA